MWSNIIYVNQCALCEFISLMRTCLISMNSPGVASYMIVKSYRCTQCSVDVCKSFCVNVPGAPDFYEIALEDIDIHATHI